MRRRGLTIPSAGTAASPRLTTTRVDARDTYRFRKRLAAGSWLLQVSVRGTAAVTGVNTRFRLRLCGR